MSKTLNPLVIEIKLIPSNKTESFLGLLRNLEDFFCDHLAQSNIEGFEIRLPSSVYPLKLSDIHCKPEKEEVENETS